MAFSNLLLSNHGESSNARIATIYNFSQKIWGSRTTIENLLSSKTYLKFTKSFLQTELFSTKKYRVQELVLQTVYSLEGFDNQSNKTIREKKE